MIIEGISGVPKFECLEFNKKGIDTVYLYLSLMKENEFKKN